MTVGGSMKLTVHPASPIVNEQTKSEFADAFVGLPEELVVDGADCGPAARGVSWG